MVSGGGGGLSAMEYQSRRNESVVVVVDDNLEVGVREEGIYGDGGGDSDVPKTPTGGVEGHDEIDRIDVEPSGSSVSLNCHTFCSQDRLSVADILRASDEDDEDEDLVVQMENGFQICMGIGTSSKGGVDDLINQQQLQHCKWDRSGALGLLRSPLAMKRSISTGRFVFTTRHGKGKNSVIPN